MGSDVGPYLVLVILFLTTLDLLQNSSKLLLHSLYNQRIKVVYQIPLYSTVVTDPCH